MDPFEGGTMFNSQPGLEKLPNYGITVRSRRFRGHTAHSKQTSEPSMRHHIASVCPSVTQVN